jgi:hypothetical protein
MKFSPCGKFLATAGKDTHIKVWILRSSYKYYRDLIKNYNSNGKLVKQKIKIQLKPVFKNLDSADGSSNLAFVSYKLMFFIFF